ncbi:MAG: D-inositol-3-phosphate glycosyltransferase [Dermatophilaceae bacterium]
MTAPLRRMAMISLHTSPLAQPGAGDAGGLNVYVLETARRLGRRGIDVEIFTRATSSKQASRAEIGDRVAVHHLVAGPYEGLDKDALPGQLCAFAAGLMRVVAHAPEGHLDVVHSHYWLSGQVGFLAAERWGVPLVHTMHTMARVKNAHVGAGDRPEPRGREIGEVQVVDAADALVANTVAEAGELVSLYGAEPARVHVVPPGVDLDLFTPGPRTQARAAVGIEADEALVLFVGRIQPLKAPDVLIRALARLARDSRVRGRVRLVLLGGASGTGLARPDAPRQLAAGLGLADRVDVLPPVDRPTLAQWYRAADLVAVPSRSESFGLVAIEALACGTPVVAADVGGLPVAVGPGGVLVQGHDPAVWAGVLGDLMDDPVRRDALARAGIRHAAGFGWEATVDRLIEVYAEAIATAGRSRAVAS